MEILEKNLGLDSAHRVWIERIHTLERYNRLKAARPVIVAFSSYRYVESVMANVHKLRDTDYSVNRDFPTEIARARKLLWPKLKQIRERNPLSKASLGYPAKLSRICSSNGTVFSGVAVSMQLILVSRTSKVDARTLHSQATSGTLWTFLQVN